MTPSNQYIINRELEKRIRERIGKGKAIVLLGPRQTGKTTLIKKIIGSNDAVISLSGDDSLVREQLSQQNTQEIKRIIGNKKILFIDEAQRIKDIGLTLKIIIDQLQLEQIYVTGSSALEIASEINEPLTGRKWEYMLYPISWSELEQHFGYLDASRQLEQRIIYGSYPDVINNPGDASEILREISGSYLYKDLLMYQGIKKPEILDKLLRALALQIGNEVSYNELSRLIQVDKNTVQVYIDLLEKAFVIFRLQPLSRNLRNEISTSRKIYFYDTGIRNALISNFNPLVIRSDIGPLWENFMISERRKIMEYERISANTFFWRTTYQQEIDYIEERDGKMHAFEFKWNQNAKARIPKKFIETYPGSETRIVHNKNFQTIL